MTNARGQYREVADQIRAAIQRGDYARGSLLPTEDQLADELGVHRATVNKALVLLRGEGLVRVHRGKGTYVTEIPIIRRDAVGRQLRSAREEGQARGAFSAELQRLGLEDRSEVTVDQVPAPARVAELLNMDEGATLLARRRHMFANNVPVQLATSYFPLDIAEGTQLAELDTGTGGAYSRLADLGHAPVTFNESVRVRPPAEDEVTALRMDPDQRVYDIVRTAKDESGRVVEVNVMTLPTHQWELNFEWTNFGELGR